MRARTHAALARALAGNAVTPARLTDAMGYSTLGGGKRIRAMLAYAAHPTFGAATQDLDGVACAVEMIHAYSLIHDDLPCMDDDVLRRGQPTCHVKFDEATAMLAGDALQPLAFMQLVKTAVSDAQKSRLVALLAHASGHLGMAGGQAIDLFNVGATISIHELETMHRLKTGALIHASAMMGVVCADGVSHTEQRAVSDFADALGLAFQIVDDILDVEGNAESLGKTAGKDAQANKPTFVSLLGLDGAKQRAAQITQAAHDAIAVLTDRAACFHAIADEVLIRKY
jgi:farnesyl diphosphate synthase